MGGSKVECPCCSGAVENGICTKCKVGIARGTSRVVPTHRRRWKHKQDQNEARGWQEFVLTKQDKS